MCIRAGLRITLIKLLKVEKSLLKLCHLSSVCLEWKIFFSFLAAYVKEILHTQEMAFKHALKSFLNYNKTLELIVTRSTSY